MKKFTLLKESVNVEIEKTEIQKILSNLAVHSNIDLTDKEVEIIGLDDAEVSLQEHVDAVKNAAIRQTVYLIEESLKNGQPWNLVVEKILNNE